MEMTVFLKHLQDIASSPYAFIGYISVVSAWVYIATAQHRLKTISKIIRDLPEEDRAKVISKEYNTTPRSGLSPEQWIRSRLHTLYFLAFFAVIICATILIVIAIYTKPLHREASLSLVDLSVIDTDEYPKLDVKVRNNSEEVVFLKKAEVTTLAQWDIPNPGTHPSAVPVSWTYDVQAPLNGVATYNISQEVKPNSTDRFDFRVGSNHSTYPFVGLFAYLLQIKLIYNENNREILTPAVLLHIPGSMTPVAYYQGTPDLSELEENKKVAQEILKKIDKDTIVKKDILEAIKSWANADFTEFKKKQESERGQTRKAQ